jgi:hypothetical protein
VQVDHTGRPGAAVLGGAPSAPPRPPGLCAAPPLLHQQHRPVHVDARLPSNCHGCHQLLLPTSTRPPTPRALGPCGGGERGVRGIDAPGRVGHAAPPATLPRRRPWREEDVEHRHAAVLSEGAEEDGAGRGYEEEVADVLHGRGEGRQGGDMGRDGSGN